MSLFRSISRPLMLAFVLASHALRAESPPPYNVLVLLADDLTASALSCYGAPASVSPNIDRLARESLQFTQAYCQFPVCAPSRAALMSGQYPQTNGVVGNGSANRFTENLGTHLSLPQLFKQQGYYTARVGKIYHMRVPGDITAGVDGPDHIDSWTERFNCKGLEWMSEGTHHHWSKENLNKDPEKHYNLGFGSAFYAVEVPDTGFEQPDAQAARKAVELLETHRNHPFFLALGFIRPHVPLVAPQTDFQAFPPDSIVLPPKIPGDWDDIPEPGRSVSSISFGIAERTDHQQAIVSAYYASVRFMDRQVGEILSALDRLDLRKKTIVVFMSDHGYHLGEHDFWQKMSLHEESARIPFLLSVPGHAPQVTSQIVEQIDLYPTLAELCQLPKPVHCQGVSLVPLLTQPTCPVKPYAYCLRGTSHLIRTSKWAYMRHGNGTQELYDMIEDPQQYTNLITDPATLQARDELNTLLNRHLATISKGPQQNQ